VLLAMHMPAIPRGWTANPRSESATCAALVQQFRSVWPPLLAPLRPSKVRPLLSVAVPIWFTAANVVRPAVMVTDAVVNGLACPWLAVVLLAVRTVAAPSAMLAFRP
jgi:hypothetical protein